MVQLFTAPFAVLLDITAYLASAMLNFLRKTDPPTSQPSVNDAKNSNSTANTEDPKKKEASTSWTEGIRLVWAEPVLRAIALSAAHFNFFCAAFSATLTYFMVRELGFSPIMVGAASIASGIVGVIATVVASRLMVKLTTPLLFAMSYLVAGIGAMSVPMSILTNREVAIFAMVSTGLAVWAFAIIINLVMSQTITQYEAPPKQIGQVVSATRWLSP